MFVRVNDWPRRPDDWEFSMVTGVAVDSRGRIHVAHRGIHPLVCFDPDGNFLGCMGDAEIDSSVYYKLNRNPATAMGQKRWIHGLSADAAGNIWVTDVGRHIVMKFDPDGKLLQTLGTADISGESMELFNQPTHVLVAPGGEIYVTDGYGNSRVVKLSPDGKPILSWGKRGRGPGEFDIPHCLAIDEQGLIYVADRGNNRIQVFDENGGFLAEWPGLRAPDGVFFLGDCLYASLGLDNRILKLNREGRVLASWGSNETLGFPHGICPDGEGNLYVAEILANRATRLAPV